MYQVTLDQSARQELQKRTHQRDLAPRTRGRLEMVRLSAAGWSIPKIAGHLQFHEYTVRAWIKRYLDKGFDALEDQPHRGQTSAIGSEILTQVHHWVEAGERTWNAPQVAEQVAQTFGIQRSRQQWCRLLGREGLTCKRTRRSLKHKQKPEQVAQKRADLETLEKSVPIWRRSKKGGRGPD